MTVSGGLAPTSGSTDVPVLPGADEARRWARDELSRKIYQDAKPGLAEQIWARVVKFFTDVLNELSGINGNLGVVLLGVVLLALVAVAIWLVRPQLNRRQPNLEAEIFGPEALLTAGEHRELAQQAAMVGDYAGAVTAQFRALVRTAEERAILESQPGRTVDEATAGLIRAFGAHRGSLLAAAGCFNGVRYGDVVAAAADFVRLKELDHVLLEHRPQYDGGPGALAAPR
ncbi:DUF4129 domain-containing protein [Arthrobacter sp. H14-L1]|uniref:DUF4129 domain-containing protein n=1 Tax=Arthrobacter sp. H14-L1 TaxID=2996697 RepID=UPI00226DE324|nr:DUF4129 domain-containing protein [Arthrobacter sp. H14-L1]MCY0903544.1 DUF4129 domain-containing protein [Arthrobacter sp. H14-L1]